MMKKQTLFIVLVVLLLLFYGCRKDPATCTGSLLPCLLGFRVGELK